MKATECKCVDCGKPAVAFWPVIDPDIPSHPYCRECLDIAKFKLFIEMFAEVDMRPKDPPTHICDYPNGQCPYGGGDLCIGTKCKHLIQITPDN